MKFVCSQSELSTALGLACRVVPSRPSHPILADVLLQASGGILSITAFDLSTGIMTKIPASIETEGSAAIPAKIFHEIISKLPSDCPISIEKDDEIRISSLSGSFVLTDEDAENYPDLPIIKSSNDSLEINASILLAGIKSTSFCASDDESKAILRGIHIESSSKELVFAATDGHRLAVCRFPGHGGSKLSLTVPSRSLSEVRNMILDEQVCLNYEKGQLVLSSGVNTLTCRTLDGTYPGFEKLIPNSFENHIEVARKPLINALGRVGIIASTGNNVVKLNVTPDGITVTAESDTKKGKEIIAADNSLKQEFNIAFNVRYLVDALKGLSSERVVIKCNSPTTPVVVVALEDDDQDCEQLYLIMPVQVKSDF